MSPSSQSINILKTELNSLKTLLESSLSGNVQDRDLITIDTKIGIIYSHLIILHVCEHDLTLLLSIASEFSKHLQNPLIGNSYYTNFKQRLPTTFPDVKTLYITTLLRLLNKPTIKNLS